MDPNAALERILECADMIIVQTDEGASGADIHYDANELAEAVQALHGWLSRGGFLPSQWERKS